MQISLEWLEDFVETPPLAELCERLEALGAEVEAVADPAVRSEGVIVGEVLTCEKHPEADRLNVCTVSDGNDEFQVVCGASNVAQGQRVAFAPPGASFKGSKGKGPKGGFSIGKRKLRGVESAGMLASKEELGLAESSDGIWVLPSDAPLGEDVLKAMKVAPVLTLGITPNRPDLLSHVGVAREISAATGKRLKPVPWRVSEKGGPVASSARVLVEQSDRCPRYVARVVRDIKVGPSPAWLVERLESVGQRSVNNVVDATNYVLLEYGQPMHAFDLDRLALQDGLPTVVVRMANAGEKLKTLDDVERELNEDDLVIADSQRALAIAGVMGGADSEVNDATTSVLLESAYFEPTGVRRSAKRHGMHTESSHRFERGVDPDLAARAAERCAQLLQEIAAGQVAKGAVEVARKSPPAVEPKEIELRLQRITRILGLERSAEEVVKLLEPLEIRCLGRNENALRFVAPTFRPDLTREVDLIEEVARRIGYDNIPERLPDASGPYGHNPPIERPQDIVRTALLGAGCSEAVTYGFGSSVEYSEFAAAGTGQSPADDSFVSLLNPLGEEMSTLRTSLLPGLLGALRRNQRQGQPSIRLFEIGQTFLVDDTPGKDELPERDRHLPAERTVVALLMSGGRFGGRWYQGNQEIEFGDLAGAIEEVVESFDLAELPILTSAKIPGLNPHAAAIIELGGSQIGSCGQLHPSVAHKLELEGAVFVAEIDILRLADARHRRIEHHALAKFPGTRRDVAILAPKNLPAERLRSFIEANAGGEMGKGVVEAVRIFDVYQGKGIADDKVSIAIAIDYRNAERTLVDDEVAQAFDALQVSLVEQFSVEIR